MKKVQRWILILISLLLAGCYIPSLNPFYTKDASIDLKGINGEWLLLKEFGEDVSGKSIRPWVFRDDEVKAYNQDDQSAELNVEYFNVDDTIFIDVSAGEPEGFPKMCPWWGIHLQPLHTVYKVSLSEDSLTITPLNPEWFKTSLKNKKISIPFVETQDEQLIVTAQSEEWIAFLKEYGSNDAVFLLQNQSILQRKR